MAKPKPVYQLEGQVFGKWTVLPFHTNDTREWLCRCECGTEDWRTAYNLVHGRTSSCGCVSRTKTKGRHQETRERNEALAQQDATKCARTKRTWASMMDRCENPYSLSYEGYGALGKRVCEKWKTIEGFVEDMGRRPEGMTLDRINNELGYFKENCRWATPSEQSYNRRPYSHNK